jgi:glycyl-tRNA synthetase (class II)
VREFTLAEIEHFVDPEDKSHPKFKYVKDLEFLLYPRAEQLGAEKKPVLTKIGDAVAKVGLKGGVCLRRMGTRRLFQGSLIVAARTSQIPHRLRKTHNSLRALCTIKLFVFSTNKVESCGQAIGCD